MKFVEGQEESRLASQLRRSIGLVDRVILDLQVFGMQSGTPLDSVTDALRGAQRYTFTRIPELVIPSNGRSTVEAAPGVKAQPAVVPPSRRRDWAMVVVNPPTSVEATPVVPDMMRSLFEGEARTYEELRQVLRERTKRPEEEVPIKKLLLVNFRGLPLVVEEIMNRQTSTPLDALDFMDGIGFDPRVVVDWDMKENLIIPGFAKKLRPDFIGNFRRIFEPWRKGYEFQRVRLHQIFEYAAMATNP